MVIRRHNVVVGQTIVQGGSPSTPPITYLICYTRAIVSALDVPLDKDSSGNNISVSRASIGKK